MDTALTAEGGRAVYGDFSRLERIADDFEALAAQIGAEAAEYRRRAEQAPWASASAEAYRETVREDCRRALRAADGLGEAAHSLRRHVAQARAAWDLGRRLDAAAAAFLSQVVAWIR